MSYQDYTVHPPPPPTSLKFISIRVNSKLLSLATAQVVAIKLYKLLQTADKVKHNHVTKSFNRCNYDTRFNRLMQLRPFYFDIQTIDYTKLTEYGIKLYGYIFDI